MSNDVEVIRVTMPSGGVMETDLDTINFVKEFESKYHGGTVVTSWSDTLKMVAAQEYLKQQGGAQ